MHPSVKSYVTRLLILGGLIVAAGAITRMILRPSRHKAPSRALLPDFDPDTPVLPPSLARDPFLNATPKPPALVAPRPTVRGEAAIAMLAVGAYVAVFALSAFGGDQAPDLLSIRANESGNPAPLFAADVLSSQSTAEPVVTETVAPSVAPALKPASEPEPTPVATAERPTQHVLRPGETLISVAALYGTTAYDLAAANGLTGDLIYAGQVLNIPTR